jgi:hypothetical protein
MISNESITSYFPFDRAVIVKVEAGMRRGEEKEFLIVNSEGKKIQEIASFEYVRFPEIYSRNNILAPYLDVSSKMIHGLLDLNGKELLPQEFSGLRFLTKHTLIAVKGEEVFFIDLKRNKKNLITKGELRSIFPSGIIQLKEAEDTFIYYTIEGKKIDGVVPLN